MNGHSDLITLIAQGETENIEFKTSFQKEVFESLVAFANAKGGRVILGVSDAQKILGACPSMKNLLRKSHFGHLFSTFSLNNRAIRLKCTKNLTQNDFLSSRFSFSDRLLGLQVGVETLNNWQNQVKNATYPSLIPEMDVFELEGKTLVVITVDEQPIKPIAYKQRYFKRTRNANHLMSLDEVANEHLKTLNASWDYYIDTRHDFSDISMDKVARFIEAIEQHQNKKFSEDPYTVLSKYELIKEQKLSFGAYLLFVNNFSAITSLQIGRFKSETTIIDNIDINTDLPNQVERSLAFIRKHLMVEFIITGQAQRTERFDYPLEAIREIVINMIVHRDYRDSGTSIIKIFDDRIECFNPGKLYGDLTVKQLTSGDYVSKVRNRAITNMFKEAGIIERYGSGIKRIQQSCLTHGVVEPKLEEFQHGFRVTLYKERLEKSSNSIDESVGGGVNGGVNQLFELIKATPGLSITQMVNQHKKSKRTLERWLKQLKDQGKIEFKGAPKTGGYYAIND